MHPKFNSPVYFYVISIDKSRNPIRSFFRLAVTKLNFAAERTASESMANKFVAEVNCFQ